MRRSRRRLPVPQHEFGFTPDTFNLIAETGLDGERITRERVEAERARRRFEAAQAALFSTASVVNTVSKTVSESVSNRE